MSLAKKHVPERTQCSAASHFVGCWDDRRPSSGAANARPLFLLTTHQRDHLSLMSLLLLPPPPPPPLLITVAAPPPPPPPLLLLPLPSLCHRRNRCHRRCHCCLRCLPVAIPAAIAVAFAGAPVTHCCCRCHRRRRHFCRRLRCLCYSHRRRRHHRHHCFCRLLLLPPPPQLPPPQPWLNVMFLSPPHLISMAQVVGGVTHTLSMRTIDYIGSGQPRGSGRGHDRRCPWFPCNFLSNKNRCDMELGMFVVVSFGFARITFHAYVD